MIGYNPVREGKTRKRKVCFSQGGNCCAHQVTVKTKRCPGEFLVYMLPAVPTGNGRYCGHASKYLSSVKRFQAGKYSKKIQEKNKPRIPTSEPVCRRLENGLLFIKD